MKTYIERLIKKKKKRYEDDHDEMLGDYYREEETIKGYNGRQLLELLQNCDDEGACEVLIKLDRKAQTISISNTGKPFSQNGYRSLFIPNLSSKKSKRRYIGNKGLGFRAIINWSNEIEIQSNSLSLKYNEKNRLETFNNLVPKELRDKIVKDEGLRKGTIPIPFLTMPQLAEINQGRFATTIIIHYKKEFLEKGILNQVKKITPETLFFLRKLERIKFEGFDKDITDIETRKERINLKTADFSPKERISFNGNKWLVFEEEQFFDIDFKENKEEKEFYQIKIAVDEAFNKSVPYLYSFFPTNIQLNQPYILHATFDLDSTRNQLVHSDKNKIILAKVVNFTIKVAKYFSSEAVSYKPLEILNHKHKADTLNNLGYYELLKKAINTEAIFPCIDNSYKTLKESIYISDDFANMLQHIGAQKDIHMHLIPMRSLCLSDFEWESDINTTLAELSDVDKVINGIAEREMDDESRAIFISQIVKECDFIIKKYNNKINFLINDTDERKVIKGDEYIYTTVTKDNQLKTPDFAKIQFINKDLFENLLVKFNFESEDNPNKGRFVYEKLRGFCNIHSYEPATLAQKIISETRTQIDKNPASPERFIKEMNNCLFHNYRQFDDDTKLPENVKTPAISKNKKIKYIHELMFSDFYPTGKKTELIFKGIYTEEDYIDSPANLGLEISDNLEEIENYFRWLGVNDFAVYTQETYDNYGVDDYRDYIINRHDNHLINMQRYKTTIHKIKNLATILENISIECLILWINFDKRLYKQIDNMNNDDIYNYIHRGEHCLAASPSYIKYQIITLYRYNFQDYLIDEMLSWVNDFSIDYRKDFFVKNGISVSSINAILISLDAKDDFNNLSIEKVADILNKLPQKYPNGKKTQTIYRKAFNHYKENELELSEKIRLFADDGDELKPYDQSEIYFSDRIKLPKQLRKKYPVFNFPSRSGGAEAITFFKINDLKDVKIDLVGNVLIQESSDQLSKLLDKLRPLILTYRINSIDDIKIQKANASICNKIKILLCSELKYKIDENIYEVAEYEFLHHNEYSYYIKVKTNDALDELRQNSIFIDSCTDIISLSFDISSERDAFRNLFRNDYQSVLKDVKNDLGEDILQEARELLGLADYKHAFWQSVMAAKGIIYNEKLDDLALENFINQKLDIDFDLSTLDYENINDETEIYKIQKLFTDINLEFKVFSDYYMHPISLSEMHFNKIKNAILSKKNIIKSAVWGKLRDQTIDEQALYLSEINKFEKYQDFAMQLSSLKDHTFHVDYANAAEDFSKSIYGVIDLSKAIDTIAIYEKNSSNFTDDELFKINQSERLKSLLYFEKALATIKLELCSNGQYEVTEPVNNNTNSTNELLITSSDNLKLKNKKSGMTKNWHNVFTPKETNQRRLKEMGNQSEKIVLDYLRANNFDGIDPVSKDNEGLHCDIRYCDKNGIVKYIEVKTFDNGRFYLTKSEYDFGQSEKDNYEIWLVRNKKEIIPIKDFFSNKKYSPIISEYEVYLDLAEEDL